MKIDSLRRSWPRTRMRRLRRHRFVRDLVREHELLPKDLIWPLFVTEGKDSAEPVPAMPGVKRLSIDRAVAAAKSAAALGIPAVALFPVIDPTLKTANGKEAWNPEGLIPRAVRALKDAVPELGVITDVALDPYTSHGQDGLVDQHSKQVLNDETVAVLCQQALCHAAAGADMVAPSDMMDGRIGAVRKTLETEGFRDTIILAYTAKYASSYYGPFRSAVGSAKSLGGGNKRQYQMDPGNSDEAWQECLLDLHEGADILMVKPAMPCLDVIAVLKQRLSVPIFAYQVSGEYSMHCAAFDAGMLDRDAVILESLLCIKRAGSSAILSYFALEAAQLIAALH